VQTEDTGSAAAAVATTTTTTTTERPDNTIINLHPHDIHKL